MKFTKYIKRILSFLTIGCCLLGSSVPVYAMKVDHNVSGSLEGQTPRIVYTNEEIPSRPNLYVTKSITSTAENVEIPENDEFTFTLWIDGKLAKGREYRLFDRKGTEFNKDIHIEPKEDDDEVIKNLGPEVANKVQNESVTEGVLEPFKTDDNSGSFTLKEGQVAVFEELGSGTAYEVKENSKEGYIQIEPAGGASVPGTMKDKAEVVTFTNLYTPSDDGEKTDLEIRKTVSFPKGYTPPESPDFPFKLVLKGGYEADEEHEYIISDIKTGNIIRQETMLGNEVDFTLKGDQMATFKDIDVDIDYKVSELNLPENENLDGWRQTYSSESEGTTKSPVTPVVFNNASAAFTVTKNMEDNSKPDQEFTFQLTKGEKENCSVWEGAKYYLYSTTGEMITLEESGDEKLDDETQKEDIEKEDDKKNAGISGTTDKNGLFKLKPGQAAVFVNVKPGTIYNVSEISNPDYIQTVPNSAEGYTSKTVSDAVEILPFVNKEAEKALTVTKKLGYTPDDDRRPAEQQKFYFILSEGTEKNTGDTSGENTSGEGTQVQYQYTPVVGEIYTKEVGGSEYTEKTDENGGFWVGANETVRFFSLTKGKHYKVEEQNHDSYSDEYKLPDSISQEGDLAGSEGLAFTFENLYTPDKLDLYLIKAKNPQEDIVLEGAKFRLVRVEIKEDKINGEDSEEDGQEKPTEGTTGSEKKKEVEKEIGVYTTDAEGKITISGLNSGTYRLYEIEAPVGYQLMKHPVTIQVERIKDKIVNGSKELKVTINDSQKDINVEKGTAFKGPGADGSVISKEPEGYFIMGEGSANDELHIKVYNDPLYDLPSAGGQGIFLYILSGIVLMMAASYLYWKKVRLRQI